MLRKLDWLKAAGFTVEDDQLPAFFYNKPLTLSNKVTRFHADEVHNIYQLI